MSLNHLIVGAEKLLPLMPVITHNAINAITLPNHQVAASSSMTIKKTLFFKKSCSNSWKICVISYLFWNWRAVIVCSLFSSSYNMLPYFQREYISSSLNERVSWNTFISLSYYYVEEWPFSGFPIRNRLGPWLPVPHSLLENL